MAAEHKQAPDGHDSEGTRRRCRPRATPAAPQGRALAEHNIRVAVRVRPLSERETTAGARSIVEFADQQQLRLTGCKDTFAFDHVGTQNTSQVGSAHPLRRCLAGGCLPAPFLPIIPLLPDTHAPPARRPTCSGGWACPSATRC